MVYFAPMKTILATVGAALTAVTLGAAEADSEKSEKLEEEETAIFEAGFDFDFNSAYIDKNAVANDDMVMQPCVWADLTYFEPFWLGFSIWQNYDLTDRRKATYKYGLNETDYNVHLGATVWESEDEEYSVGLELGHEWFTYHGVRDEARDSSPNTSEIYLKATFDNPFVNVYGKAAYMYGDYGDYKKGMYYSVGFNKEVELCDSLTAGIDWDVGFGDSHYLQFLYGDCDYRSWTEVVDEEEVEREKYSNPDGGIGGTTVKLYLVWDITEWMSLGGTIAYTGVLNGSAREGLGNREYYTTGYWDDGTNDMYPRDLFWGGINFKLKF